MQARIWFFNLTFTLTFSALFWKVHRMWRIVNNPKLKRIRIPNKEIVVKVVLTLLVDVVILGISTAVDPYKPMVNPTLGGAAPPDFVDHIVCSTESNGTTVTLLVWRALLVCAGCVLAFRTRNMEAKYAESKGLLIAMYNVAFIGIVIVLLVFFFKGVGENGKTLLKAIGIFWGSVFSVAAIVVPRLMMDKKLVKSLSLRRDPVDRFGGSNRRRSVFSAASTAGPLAGVKKAKVAPMPPVKEAAGGEVLRVEAKL